MRSAASSWWRASALLLLVLSSGCAASSDAMVEALVPLPELPRAGHAIVVFVRPSTYAEGVRFPIVDHSGRFLGHSLPATWFEAEFPPGRYAFYAEAENTAAVRAELAPDRTYFVEVAPRPGWFKSRVQLLPIAPRHDSWADREEWLAESVAQRLYQPGASDLDHDDLADILEDGREVLAGYDDEELSRRTIYAADGI